MMRTIELNLTKNQLNTDLKFLNFEPNFLDSFINLDKIKEYDEKSIANVYQILKTNIN